MLHLGDLISPFLFQFIDQLSSKEVSSLRNLTIFDGVGWYLREDESQYPGAKQAWQDYWEILEEKVKRFTSLDNCYLALDAIRDIKDDGLDYATLVQMDEDFQGQNITKAVELFYNFPKSLIRRYNLNPTGPNIPQKKVALGKEWAKKLFTLVWHLKMKRHRKFC